MKRNLVLAVAGVFAVATATVVWKSQRPSDPGQRSSAIRADSVWYHASDIALLAKTGRPQLVEFFRPN